MLREQAMWRVLFITVAFLVGSGEAARTAQHGFHFINIAGQCISVTVVNVDRGKSCNLGYGKLRTGCNIFQFQSHQMAYIERQISPLAQTTSIWLS